MITVSKTVFAQLSLGRAHNVALTQSLSTSHRQPIGLRLESCCGKSGLVGKELIKPLSNSSASTLKNGAEWKGRYGRFSSFGA
jgi:hypothetical protein